MIVYIENPIDSTKKLLNVINEFGKTVGYKVNIQKSKTFLYTNNETSEAEIRKKIPFDIATRKIKYLRINLTKEVKRPVLRKLHNTEERNQGRHKQMETYTMFMDQKN